LRVAVHFYGFVRDVARNNALALELPAGSTLRDLFNEMIKLSGEKLRDRLFTHGGDLETNVQIFVGADQVTSLEQVIADGAGHSQVKIIVLSATAGG
jgi:molybdopterin converting factor small subunit